MRALTLTGGMRGALTLGLGLLLSACGMLEPRDSAPARDIDHSRVENAVPREEPLSRYGNPASYVVAGVRYDILPSASGYQAEGVASWYGTKFHGRRTSSGEPYDMYAMSAAHKTLPIPSYVEVTNLDTGHSIIVRVNDRGPFVDDRLIDLSYVAAKKLGITARGTGRVRVRALETRAPEPTTQLAAAPSASAPAAAAFDAASPNGATETGTAPAAANGQLYLQVGAFAEQANAAQLMLRLAAEITETILINRVSSGADNLYRVRIGPLASEVDAERLRLQLGNLGIPAPRIVVE